MDSSKKRCPFCCLGIFTWATPMTHTRWKHARALAPVPLHAGLLEPGVALALAAAQRGAAPVENELSSAVAGPARTHARPCRGGGGSGAREGREAEAALSSFGSSTGDVCSFNSCCLATNHKAEGGHFLPSDVKSTNM